MYFRVEPFVLPWFLYDGFHPSSRHSLISPSWTNSLASLIDNTQYNHCCAETPHVNSLTPVVDFVQLNNENSADLKNLPPFSAISTVVFTLDSRCDKISNPVRYSAYDLLLVYSQISDWSRHFIPSEIKLLVGLIISRTFRKSLLLFCDIVNRQTTFETVLDFELTLTWANGYKRHPTLATAFNHSIRQWRYYVNLHRCLPYHLFGWLLYYVRRTLSFNLLQFYSQLCIALPTRVPDYHLACSCPPAPKWGVA